MERRREKGKGRAAALIRREESLFVREDPGYKWNAGDKSAELQHAFVAALHGEQAVLVIGPSGVGKTLAVRQFAYDFGSSKIDMQQQGSPARVDLRKIVGRDYAAPVAFIRCQGTPDTTYWELCGHWLPVDGGATFIEGLLPEAVRLANERGLAVLLIDEINTIRPEYQKALNSLLSDRLIVFENRSWQLDEKARLLVVGTMNDFGHGYGGISELNEDLQRRFGLKVVLDYPVEEEETAVLRGYTNDVGLIRKLILLANHTRGSRATNAADPVAPFTRPISTADLTNFLVAYRASNELYDDASYALSSALRLTLLNKYHSQEEHEAMVAISQKITDIFGIEITK